MIHYLTEHFGTAPQIENLAIALHKQTGRLIRPYHMDNAATNYTAATAHYEAWRSIKMITDHDINEHGEEQALARASQGGHTN